MLFHIHFPTFNQIPKKTHTNSHFSKGKNNPLPISSHPTTSLNPNSPFLKKVLPRIKLGIFNFLVSTYLCGKWRPIPFVALETWMNFTRVKKKGLCLPFSELNSTLYEFEGFWHFHLVKLKKKNQLYCSSNSNCCHEVNLSSIIYAQWFYKGNNRELFASSDDQFFGLNVSSRHMGCGNLFDFSSMQLISGVYSLPLPYWHKTDNIITFTVCLCCVIKVLYNIRSN